MLLHTEPSPSLFACLCRGDLQCMRLNVRTCTHSQNIYRLYSNVAKNNLQFFEGFTLKISLWMFEYNGANHYIFIVREREFFFIYSNICRVVIANPLLVYLPHFCLQLERLTFMASHEGQWNEAVPCQGAGMGNHLQAFSTVCLLAACFNHLTMFLTLFSFLMVFRLPATTSH